MRHGRTLQQLLAGDAVMQHNVQRGRAV